MQPRFKLSLFEKGCDTFFLFVDQGKQEIFKTFGLLVEKEKTESFIREASKGL